MYSGPFIFWNIPCEPDPTPEVSVATTSTTLITPLPLQFSNPSPSEATSSDDAINNETSTSDVTSTEISPSNVTSNELDPELMSSDGESSTDEELDEDALQVDMEARERRLKRFEQYFNNRPIEDLDLSRNMNPNLRHAQAYAQAPKTPTTPLRGMTLEDPIDLTASPDKLVNHTSHDFINTLDAGSRVDTPFNGAFTPSRPDYSPLSTPTLAPVDSSVKPAGGARLSKYKVTGIAPSFFTFNALDHLGVTASYNSEPSEFNSPYLNNKQIYHIVTQSDPRTDESMADSAKEKYAGLLNDPLGHSGSVTRKGMWRSEAGAEK